MSTSTQQLDAVEPLTDSSAPVFNSVGVELEYPILEEGDRLVGSNGCYSGDLRRAYWDGIERRGMLDNLGRGPDGHMGSDHVGAEIRSSILRLNTDEPERWYESALDICEHEYGYPFAATGLGDTTFGLHQHISTLTEDEAEKLNVSASTEWARVFWCSSISEESLDPWRHGGCRTPHECEVAHPRGFGDEGHYEFRMPEPVEAEHFGLMMDFWRLFAQEGPEAAIDAARELVHQKDDRLTAIRQYKRRAEVSDNFPEPTALNGNRRTHAHVAEWFYDLMENA